MIPQLARGFPAIAIDHASRERERAERQHRLDSLEELFFLWADR